MVQLQANGKISPRVSAGIFSRLFFWWMTKIFRDGRKKPFTLNDLYDVLEEDKSDALGKELLVAWNQEERKRDLTKDQKPRLFRVLFRQYAMRYLTIGALIAIEELIIQIGRPLCLGLCINYFSYGHEDKSQYFDGYGALIVSGVIGGAVIYPILHHTYFFQTQRLGMQIRIAVSALIYRKAMKISRKELSQITTGKILNLLSNDASRFDTVLAHIHFIWIAPIQLGIVVYFIWGYFKSWCIIGVVLMVLFAPFQGLMGKLFGKLRHQTSIFTDNRMKLLDEIISGIKIVKLYAMEYLYFDKIKEARKKECSKVQNTAYLRIVNSALHHISSKLIVSSTLIAYALSGNQLTSENVFVTIALYNSVRTVFTFFAPLGISQLSETLISIKRIDEFLNTSEISNSGTQKLDPTASSTVALKLENLTGSWETTTTETLSDITFEVKRGNLVGIIGRTGSGKSSLLQAILNELKISNGKVYLNGSIAYASQEPWIFEASLKENILFGKPYEKNWYDKVINACALRDDLKGFLHGDETLVGDKGSCLSGGQMSRVNLARAVYSKADILLLDDPISAVDTNVANHIFKQCFKGILKGVTVLLITHHTQFLPEFDQIVILENGKLRYSGHYASVQEDSLVTKNISVDSTQVPSENFKPNVTLSVNMDYIKEDELVPEVLDNKNATIESGSKIGGSGELFWKYFRSGTGYFGIAILILSSILAQAVYAGSDYWLQLWVNAEEQNIDIGSNQTSQDYTPIENNADRNFYLFGYGIFVGSVILSSLMRSTIFYILAIKSSISIHIQLSWSVLRATMNFFEENSLGKILNVFSKDIGIIDDILPITMYEALEASLTVISIMVIVSIVNPVLVGPSAVVLVFAVGIRSVYLITARRIKLVEGMTKGPVFAHVASSLSGITTIRAHQSQDNAIMEFDSYQNTHTSAWFLVLSGARWLAFAIELILILFISVVTISFLLFSRDGSKMGLAISSAMTLTGMFPWCVRQAAETENLLISVERVLRFTKIDSEPPLEQSESDEIAAEKALNGKISFDNVMIKYDENIVLNDISIEILKGQKIGIVGRTGSGKTTLISSLFRLVDPANGTIKIGDKNIAMIGLHELRSNISIIPQEPVLFNGTIRSNLDPFGVINDASIWEAIRKVNFEQTIKNLQHGLDFVVKDKGSNFSVGEKQLVCLCRAILQYNEILVLDEATASLDKETDALIQKTLQEGFENATVLIVAHRLETVIDCDKVLVLDYGNIKEFDSPFSLLSDNSSSFYGMVREMGATALENLRERAMRNEELMFR